MTVRAEPNSENRSNEEEECRRRFLKSTKLEFPENAKDFPEDLKTIILEGSCTPGDSRLPQDSKPDWYDPELYREGQRCALRYLAGMNEAQLLSLFLMFAPHHGTQPLIATGKSDTPFAAFQRYLSTALRLLSWYEGDPFDPSSLAWRNLVAVRRMHSAVRTMCTNTPKEELAVKFTIGKESAEDRPGSCWCPMTPFILEDMSQVTLPCPGVQLEVTSLERPYLPQFEMSFTQFSFLGLFVLYPGLFGAPYVTRRELEGLVHMWAVLGHCLGVQDKFNWCQGGLDATRKRSQAVLDYCFKHWLKQVAPSWEHMCRCAFEGIRMYVPAIGDIEPHFAYLFEDVLKMNTSFSKVLTWAQWFQLWLMRVVLQKFFRWFPSLMYGISMNIRRSVLRAANFSEGQLQELREKKFSYTRPCPR